MSVPPPSTPPPGDEPPVVPQMRELVLPLAQPRGLRKLTAGGGERYIRLHGAELTIVHSGVLREPVTLPGGIIDVAIVDRGVSEGEHGRFPVLHRMSTGSVVPREHGIEGWLWTSKAGSAYPMLSDRTDDQPNLALMFVKALGEDEVERWFQPEWLKALAERSPLGKPQVLGLLATVEHPHGAENAFRQFGVLGDVTDREVPPTHRRHLPSDTPANPTFTPREAERASTSVAPPGKD